VDGHLGLKILELQNNELALFANTMSSNSLDVSDTCYGGPDYWMIKIDSLGNKLSDYCFGGMLAENFCDAVKTTNGFILVGNTLSPQSGLVSQPQTVASAWNAWIIAVDTLGNKIWDRRYQGGALPGSGVQREAALQIIPASNNEYWITGTTNNPSGYDVTDSAYGAIDAWMFKIDGVGNIMWNKRFGSPSTARNGNSVLMVDSSIFLLCTGDTGISDVKSELGYGQSDYYLVHFRYANSATGIESLEVLNSSISIYPNPTFDVLNLSFKADLKIKSLFIISLDGKVVYTDSNPDSSVDISSLSPSIYFLKLNTDKGDIYKRFCKQ
jgi:hypothetical protein